jgi:hypothetical protein
MRLILVAFLVFLASDRTVITRDGKIHEGNVTREGVEVVVASSKGTVRLPAITVIADYASIPQARRQCESRLEQATKLYEEGIAKPDHDSMRRRLLTVSLDICNETRDLLEILEKRSPASERDSLAGLKGRLFQFMRLVRDAKGATALADGASDGPVEKVGLLGLGLTVDALPDSTTAGIITERLGSGQYSVLEELASDDAGVRAKAALKLTFPPAPFACSALAKAMQAEKDKAALAAIADALSRLDIGARLKTDLAWAAADDDSARRYAVIWLVRRLPATAAADFLAECLRTNPPTEGRMRAAFASAFRRCRPRSIEELRETLVKSKDRAVQMEAVRQLGMMRDRATLPSLKLAMSGSREVMTVAFHAIEKTGAVAIPLVLELMNDGNDEVRRLTRWLAQRITNEEIDSSTELQKWFTKNRKHIEEDEKLFWKEQEEKDFPVSAEEFAIFGRKLPSGKDQ